MKAITLKQPWASLVAYGYKEYEFRSWKTNYRGKILIHAGLSTEKDELNRINLKDIEYLNGKIIGEVEIESCILVDEAFSKKLKNINPKIYENNYIGKYAWKLKNPIVYKKAIDAKGQLGLWNIDI